MDTSPPTPRETILVLDDDEMVRRAVVRVLGRLGYTLLQAGTGQDALSVLAAHPGPVHLLITDVRLLGMRGAAVAREVRLARPTIRTLLISGGSNYDDNPFLQKPFTPDALASKVRKVLDAPS
jgi:two-component system cell cycle sensor histidine kinase/response regulator CckA